MDTAKPEQKPAEELKASALPEQLRFRSPKASFISSPIGVTNIAWAALLGQEYQATSLSFSQFSSSHSVKR